MGRQALLLGGEDRRALEGEEAIPPTPERLEELRETARKAIDASLELADGMETA